MPALHYEDPIPAEELVTDWIAGSATKFAWFLSNGYKPHLYQTFFHGVTDPDTGKLCRYRHLVAGRRGGKTMAAAWELAFYVTHPEEFHWDYRGIKSDRPLTVWVVTKDFPTGHAALTWFREVLKTAGFTHGVEYKENRGNHWFEFNNGGFVHFRSAEDPESLRGAGLDILWMDEAAVIVDERAYHIARPALSDHRGQVWTTTTPQGKNWLYREFWNDKVKARTDHARVEYRSIDNVDGFPLAEWQEMLETYHPMMFKQEYMASFDSMAGIELHGDWLSYYHPDELPKDKDNPAKLALDVYIGVDPAISLSDRADRFAMAVVGVTKDLSQAYLLEIFADRIPFPEQVERIQDAYLQWHPQFIGVEITAYQRALEQQILRLPGFIPVMPMAAKGKKFERILAMAPLFRAKRVKVQKTHNDFINEWIDYDSTKKNPEDDCLDSVEIALRTAGALLPFNVKTIDVRKGDEWADRIRDDMPKSPKDDDYGVDDHLGAEW